MPDQPKPTTAYTPTDLRAMADRITNRSDRAIVVPSGSTAIYAEALMALAEKREKVGR